MDAKETGTIHPAQAASRHASRGMLAVAMVCFTLPFLTVTCYGDDVTLSGVQAATTIDLTLALGSGDPQFALGGEPPSAFALVALVATVLGLVLSFGSSRLRATVTRSAAVAAIALVALFLYAFSRSTGNTVPEVGLTAAIVLLTGAAWAATASVPRWLVWAIGALAIAMIPYSLLPTETQTESAPGFFAFYAALFAAVALAVGAIGASFDRDFLRIGGRPSVVRIVGAAIVGLTSVVVIGIMAPFFLIGLFSSSEDTIGGSYLFASSLVGTFAVTTALVWLGARRILRGRPIVDAWRPVPEMPRP